MLTIQIEILKEVIGFLDKKEGLCVNPFYKASDEKIDDNIEYAKKIYEKIISGICSSYILMQAEEKGINTKYNGIHIRPGMPLSMQEYIITDMKNFYAELGNEICEGIQKGEYRLLPNELRELNLTG